MNIEINNNTLRLLSQTFFVCLPAAANAPITAQANYTISCAHGNMGVVRCLKVFGVIKGTMPDTTKLLAEGSLEHFEKLYQYKPYNTPFFCAVFSFVRRNAEPFRKMIIAEAKSINIPIENPQLDIFSKP